MVDVSIVASLPGARRQTPGARVRNSSAWHLAPAACLLAVGIVLDDELLFYLGINLVAAGDRQHLPANLFRVDGEPRRRTAPGAGAHGFLDGSCLPTGRRCRDRVAG